MNGNTKNIIIIVLAFLVIGLVVIVGLFATNTIYVDKKSKIKLTGDSYISSLEDKDSSYDNIDFNGYKLYAN